jgi:hypothetical protein
MAATLYWHQDGPVAGDTAPPAALGAGLPPGANPNRPCKPGIDYLRKAGDKNTANIAICVDQSRQNQANGTVWYWMHGAGSTNATKAWKNNLYGDGHAESRRGADLKCHWGLVNPAAW